MESKVAIFELNKITKQRNIIIIVCSLMLLTSLLQMVVIFRQNKVVVLVPSFLSSEASLSSKQVSVAYLENITRDVINTMLDVTPDNINYSSTQILKITHPVFYGKLKQQLNQRSEDIVSRRITTNFYAKSMVVNTANNQVFVSGKLLTFLGTKMVLEEEKTYSISYEYNNFKLLIVDFYEEDLTET
ncbi:MAG: type IV conjugative transfer system protein TraE [Rickettsiales bacterium]|jgi:type IV conjugative transfer system protein TraE